MREALAPARRRSRLSKEDIDKITKWGIGYKLAVIGPLELLDVGAGLDVHPTVASYLNKDIEQQHWHLLDRRQARFKSPAS